MPLFKTLLDYRGYWTGDESNIYEWTEWLAVLYFDSAGVLRKSEMMYSAETEGCYVRYFNSDGVAFHSIFHEVPGMNGEYSAFRYLMPAAHKDDGYETGEPLYVDFIVRNPDFGRLITKRINYVNTGDSDVPMPQIDDEIYDEVMNIDDLKREIKCIFDIDSLYMPEKCISVRFMNPQKGSKTFVCRNNVSLYPRISGFAEPVCELSVGYEVTVLGITDKWYKVRYNDMEGYISRESLAPIE